MRGAPVALRQPVFSRLTPRCHVRVASPIPVTAGRFFRRFAPEKPHNPIRGGPCPLEHPRCSVDVPLCRIRSAAEALFGTLRRRKPHNLIRGESCPLEHPRCSVDVPLCGIRSAAEAFFGALRLKNRRIQFEAGLAPLAPCPSVVISRPSVVIFLCGTGSAAIETPAPEPTAPGRGCYFIRRGTAAGTRAGCSSPLRTAKRRRRERACPCRSR